MQRPVSAGDSKLVRSALARLYILKHAIMISLDQCRSPVNLNSMTVSHKDLRILEVLTLKYCDNNTSNGKH